MKSNEYNVSFNPGKVDLTIKDFFPNNKEFSKQFTTALMGSKDLIFQELKEPFAQAFSTIEKDLSNRVYSKIPMKEIFLE